MAMGRPREFDVDAALDCALELFWRKGYEAASLTELTEAMGITRPSLYAAYGNKEQLFRKALDRYAERQGALVDGALARQRVREAVEALLGAMADAQTNPNHPGGCLTVHGALACSEENSGIREELACRRSAAERKLRARLEKARAEDDAMPEGEPEDLARLIMALSNGMAVQAAAGASRCELHRIIEAFMRLWPQVPAAQATPSLTEA